MANTAVLPVPDLACTIRSEPTRPRGMAASCTGEGRSKPHAASAAVMAVEPEKVAAICMWLQEDLRILGYIINAACLTWGQGQVLEALLCVNITDWAHHVDTWFVLHHTLQNFLKAVQFQGKKGPHSLPRVMHTCVDDMVVLMS
eukprot:1148386-Pelagomonas_calceolata.AAC.9